MFSNAKLPIALVCVFAFILLSNQSLASLSNVQPKQVAELQSSENKQVFTFIGRAYAPENGKLLYTETHTISLNDQGKYQSAQVVYEDETGEQFAQKELNFGDDITMPQTHFYELDSPFFYKVKLKESAVNVEYQDEQESVSNSVGVSKGISHVVDAGFDRLVNENWSSLMDQTPLVFSFLAVTRSEFYDFRLVVDELKKDSEQVVLRLEPDNAILRWILDPAYLTYDINNKQLLRFEGLTNVRKRLAGKSLDENYIAVIQYDYL